MNNEKRYQDLLEIYQKAHPDIVKQKQFTGAQAEWNRVKNSSDDYERTLLNLKAKAARVKSATISWWAQSKKKRYVCINCVIKFA